MEWLVCDIVDVFLMRYYYGTLMNKPILKRELTGIVVISVFGSVLHFIFDWSGQLTSRSDRRGCLLISGHSINPS